MLVWTSPSHAQNTAPPIAIATVGPHASDTTLATLSGTNSFDPDGGTVTYKWEVVTEAYSWVALTDDDGATTDFTIPSAELAARYGQSIEFRLTVTDDDTPSASASDTVTYNINQRPTADIALEAYLEDKTSDETGADRYTIDAVIDGPGENGNADNEWDIMESALVVLDGTGSSDPNGRVTAYSWTRLHPTADAQGFPDSGGTTSKISTDDSTTDAVETVSNLTSALSPFYVYYRLNVTDSSADSPTAAATDPAAVIKIVVWDQPAAPRATIFATTTVDDPDTAGTDELAVAKALLDNGNPRDNATAHGDLQKSVLPSDTPRWIVSPNTTIGLDASSSSDADGDTMSFEWEGARQDSTTDSLATLKVDKDAEDGTVLTATVTVTDDSRGMLSGTASVEFLVVDDNTVPDSSTGSRDDCADAAETGESPVCAGIRTAQGGSGAGIQYITADGAQGGDMKNGKPTGRVTFRGVGFDPDQPVGTLIYAWSELTTDATKTKDAGAIDAAGTPGDTTPGDNPAAVVDPDEAVLELEGAFTDTVSFDVPEVEETTSLILALSVIDQHGVAGTSTVSITILATDSDPVADAGADQIVEPESFVRLNAGGSSDPDEGDSIASYAWKLTGVATSPNTGQGTTVLKSVIDQLTKDLTAVGILPLVEDNAADGGNDDGTCEDGETCQYGQTMLTGGATAYPYFDAPKVASGIANIRLTFTLTVTDSADDTLTPPNVGLTDTDTVTITVTNKFFSGDVTGPNFCSGASLGGPRTYAFDSDGDGVADVCSLSTTRRATVARQNALTTLVAIGSTLSRTDQGNDGETDAEDGSGTQDDRTSDASFEDLVVGRTGVTAIATVGDDPDTPDVTETDAAIRDAVSAVTGTCASASDKLGDSAADLAADACATGKVSGPPAPVDPAIADVFFSGVITGPNYCTNASLGGPQTYAFDSDDDGVADVCSLPYTRREAVARQAALEMFGAHPQYAAALAAACTALGSTDFGDSAADLDKDECVVPATKPPTGDPVPTP